MNERVRAVLLTPAGRLLVIRRVWAGAAPYWVFPGGGVEPGDDGLPLTVDALSGIRLVPQEIAAKLVAAVGSGTDLSALIDPAV